MNNISDLLNKIYNELISILLKDTEEEYHEIIKSSYEDYLNDQYLDDYANYDDYDNLYEILYSIEMASWSNMPKEDRLRCFVKDEAFNNLDELSIKALMLAKDRKENGLITREDITNDILVKMEDYYSKVLPFNKELSERLLGESEVDLLYACGKSDANSIRMSRH